MRRIKVKDRCIGEGEPTFIVAEAGINHNGSIENAKMLIDAAAENGADAVKFQTHLPEKEMLKGGPIVEYIGKPLYDVYTMMELSKEDHIILKEYAEERDIIFYSTPFSVEAVDLLEEVGVPAFKIGSGEMTNPKILERAARTGKPVIISTGMSKMEEVEEAVRLITRINKNLAILQCTSAYPCPPEDINLRVMEAYKRFDYPVGISDHSQGIYVALAAITLGASIIEKHFTVDKNWPGPDQKASIDPQELRELVEGARIIEKALGTGEKKILEKEKPVRDMASESVVSVKDIPRGTIITEDVVWVKKPGTGIPAKDMGKVIGRRARRNIGRDNLIQWKDLE